MIDFTDVKAIKIPQGNVQKIMSGDTVIWEKPKGNRWNLLERTEFIGETDGATYYFDPTGQYQSKITTMPLSEEIYWNAGRHINSGVYYSKASADKGNKCTLSDITEDSFTITSGKITELYVAFPYHLNAGETITITHTRSSSNRSGYQIFNTDGTFRSYTRKNLANSAGAIDTTEFTATDECWFVWICGVYNSYASLSITDITVTIK